MRISARQVEPRLRSRLDTVPEPIIVPAPRGRVFAAWAISSPKSKFISVPASGLPINLSFIEALIGHFNFFPSQFFPRVCGETATGEKAVGGLDW